MDGDSRERALGGGRGGTQGRGGAGRRPWGEGRQPGAEAGLRRAVGLRLEARDQIFCQRPKIILVHDSNLYLLLAGPILSISFSVVL